MSNVRSHPKNAEDFTILLCSCDAYEDCWPPFFTLLERYWPQAVKHPVLLNTESKTYAKEGWSIQCLQLYGGQNNASYGTRMIRHLQQVKTPLVLLMLDDFFLRSPVDTERLNACVQSMKASPEISCFNFVSAEQPGVPSAVHVGFQELYPIAAYRLNMQAALWRTKDLLSYWKPGATPWTWECFANRKTDRTKHRFYFLMDGENPIFDYGKKPGLTWGCVRGQWCRADMEPLFQKEHIDFDFSKRGWFDLEAFNSELEKRQCQSGFREKINLLCQELYLGGFAFSCKRIGYALLKKTFHLTRSYDEYVRGKYNPIK